MYEILWKPGQLLALRPEKVRNSLFCPYRKNSTRCNNVSIFIIPYSYEAQHVSGDTPPIIRSLKLH
jgi:hypothetical protein